MYNETPAKKIVTYSDPTGKSININEERFSAFRKAPKKASGKVNDIKDTLAKILDISNSEIKNALSGMRSIKPECHSIRNIVSITIDGETYT